jgi:outer membrane lipoprotein SlyB
MRTLYALIIGLICLSSCARETSPDVYDSKNFGKVANTYPGIIKRMREITVTNGEGLQDNTTGILGGGVGGALLGSTIGHGAGTVVAEVAGGLAGAFGGAALEQKLKTEKAVEYLVELDNGQLKTVVQSPEPSLFEGEKVYVMISEDGRSRVTPNKLRYAE